MMASVLMNLLVYLPAFLFWLGFGLIAFGIAWDKHDKKKTRQRYEDDGK